MLQLQYTEHFMAHYNMLQSQNSDIYKTWQFHFLNGTPNNRRDISGRRLAID